MNSLWGEINVKSKDQITMNKLIIIILTVSLWSHLFAGCQSILKDHVGWTIIASKTIAGYLDSGEEYSDDFEGCEYARMIFFADETAVTCSDYNPDYSHRPTAIILESSKKEFKMVVEGEEFGIRFLK